MPRTDMSCIMFVKMAMQQNLGYSGDSIEMGMTSLGKEWRYYKRQLDQERRNAKREAERKAKVGGNDFGSSAPSFSRPSHHRNSYQDRDRGNNFSNYRRR